jgi:rSAM/selenodomain-associated transferase 2
LRALKLTSRLETFRWEKPLSSKLSIIIPVLNEATFLPRQLESLQPFRSRGHELIVVDGGSTDDSLELALPLCDKIERCNPGRSLQMNRGAELASGSVLVFLHCDTCLPNAADAVISEVFQDPECLWGRFDVRLGKGTGVYRLIAGLMNIRSRLTAIATGDQTLLIRVSEFNALGGYAEIPLMEDVEICKRLRLRSQPKVLRATVTSSTRRWEQQGVVRTVLLMWWLRFLFFLGVSPEKLAAVYNKSKQSLAGP